jgi:hypothetical protein
MCQNQDLETRCHDLTVENADLKKRLADSRILCERQAERY